MGKLKAFVISFSNVQGVYYAGQVVQGQLMVELSDTMKMRGIRLRFTGQAYVHWSETYETGTGNDRTTQTRDYTDSESYFHEDLLMAGRMKNQAGQDIKLPAGQHTFPFSFQLPPRLPSSFEGDYGHVRYTCKGIIDKPWAFDHTTKRAFTVIAILDLNTMPQAGMAAHGSKSKTFCCLCCRSGPLSAVFTIDRQGYVPGEAIILKAEIDNKSDRSMECSKVDFKMRTSFLADGSVKSSSKTIAKKRRGSIAEGDSDYWNGEQLVIPPLPPSDLGGCGIIKIEYTLKLHVTPSGMGFEMSIPLQVTIGTVPLRQIVEQFRPSYPPAPIMPAEKSDSTHIPPPEYGAQYSAPGAHMESTATSVPVLPTVLSDLPPPSYEECVFGKVDIRDKEDNEYTQGQTSFAPIYTYYNWGHTPSAPPPPN